MRGKQKEVCCAFISFILMLISVSALKLLDEIAILWPVDKLFYGLCLFIPSFLLGFGIDWDDISRQKGCFGLVEYYILFMLVPMAWLGGLSSIDGFYLLIDC